MRKVASVILVIGLITALLGTGVLSGCAEEGKKPTLTGVSPGSGKAGETISVTITGTDLTDASAVSFGSGITVDSYTVDSETQITATITVSSGATLGSRTASVTTLDGTGTKANAFTVESPLAPSVTGISPDSGEQAETLDATITGEGFTGATAVSFGDGVTVNSNTVVSDTQISANITIAPNATEAARDVSVTSAGGTGTGSGIFTVTWPAALDELIAAAEAEGMLNILGSGAMRPEAIEPIEQALNEKYGTDIDITAAPGPSMPTVGSNLITEYNAGETASTDLFYATESHHPTVFEAGILSADYDWKELFPYMPDDNIRLDGTIVEVASIFVGITFNTNAIPEAEVPRQMSEVLGQGLYLASTPYAAGFDRVADLEQWGYEETKTFLEAFSAEDIGLIRCGEEDRVASGEFDAFVLSCGDRDPKRLQADGAPIAHILFEDVPIMNHRNIGIPKHSAHPNAAALFTGFLVSVEGQQLLGEFGFVSHHRIEGSDTYLEYNEYVAQGIEIKDMQSDYVYGQLEKFNTWRAEFQAILRGD
jgi:ABC-type Fe3+ transport system substrate-binding protein